MSEKMRDSDFSSPKSSKSSPLIRSKPKISIGVMKLTSRKGDPSFSDVTPSPNSSRSHMKKNKTPDSKRQNNIPDLKQ